MEKTSRKDAKTQRKFVHETIPSDFDW